MMQWLEKQPSHQARGEHQRFLRGMRSATVYGGSEGVDQVADFVQNLLEVRGLAPLVARQSRQFVIDAKPQTVWDVLCACPYMFLKF